MTATSDLATVVRTLTPALRRRPLLPKRYSRAQRSDLKLALTWNEDRNIVGFGIGPKRVGGTPDYGHVSLIVFVVTKLAKSRLPKKCVIPTRWHLRTVDRQLPTDIVEVGSIPQLQATTLQPSTNAAHFSVRHGTITAVVSSRGSPRLPFVLSCCHVLAPSLAAGRQVESPPDTSSITFANHVANVAQAEPLRAGGNLPNQMDAAIATPLVGVALSNQVPGLGPLASASSLRSGQFLSAGVRNVAGVGAFTGRIQGRIAAENVAALLQDPAGRSFLFKDLVAYIPTPLPKPGDSGMPIVVNTPEGPQLIGMHIGLGRVGNTNAGAAFFVPIAPVLDRFQVDLVVS